MRCSRRHLQRLLARRCPAAFAPPRFPLPSSFLLLPRGTMGYPSIRIVGCSLLPSLPSSPKNQICSSLPPPNQDPLLPSGSIRTRRRDAASSRRWRRRLVRDGEAAAAALPQEPLQTRQSATDVVLSVLGSLGQVLQHYCEKHFHDAALQTPTPERPTATRPRTLVHCRRPPCFSSFGDVGDPRGQQPFPHSILSVTSGPYLLVWLCSSAKKVYLLRLCAHGVRELQCEHRRRRQHDEPQPLGYCWYYRNDQESPQFL